VGDKATLETLLNAAVFLIPVAAVLALLFLLPRRHRRGVPSPSGTSPEPFYAAPGRGAGTGQTAAERSQQTEPENVETTTKKIEDAIARGQKTSLSSLYFALAGNYERLGDVEARMSALRSAAGYGALHGPPGAHAAARLALAEEAHRVGDLTTACEQWQMARTAFLQGGETEQHARIEKRMRENGCPTDWVLTDF
jgi:hypothetical protein